MEKCAAGLSSVFHDKWVSFARKASHDQTSDDDSVGQITGGVFNDKQELKEFWGVRSAYMLALLRSLACGDNRVTTSDYTGGMARLSAHVEQLSATDSTTYQADWQGLWAELVSAASNSSDCLKKVLQQSSYSTEEP